MCFSAACRFLTGTRRTGQMIARAVLCFSFPANVLDWQDVSGAVERHAGVLQLPEDCRCAFSLALCPAIGATAYRILLPHSLLCHLDDVGTDIAAGGREASSSFHAWLMPHFGLACH